MGAVYLTVLLVSLAGLLYADYRFKLAFFYDARRTAITLLVAVAIFIIWDILGIQLGIFFTGDSAYVTGILLAPDLPLEEPVFLTLLCYLSLLGYRWRTRV